MQNIFRKAVTFIRTDYARRLVEIDAARAAKTALMPPARPRVRASKTQGGSHQK